MSQSDESPQGDPWSAFGYLVSGVLLYGVLGWLVDRWLGTGFIVAIGIILGAVLGTFQTWARFRIPEDEVALTRTTDQQPQPQRPEQQGPQ